MAPQRSLVCLRLGALARSGVELCTSAGLAVAASACYDGTAPRPLESCARAPPARARRRAGSPPSQPSWGSAWLARVATIVGERLVVAAGAASLVLIWRAAAARRRSAGRTQMAGPAALPWGADARFPGRGRFLNE